MSALKKVFVLCHPSTSPIGRLCVNGKGQLLDFVRDVERLGLKPDFLYANPRYDRDADACLGFLKDAFHLTHDQVEHDYAFDVEEIVQSVPDEAQTAVILTTPDRMHRFIFAATAPGGTDSIRSSQCSIRSGDCIGYEYENPESWEKIRVQEGRPFFKTEGLKLLPTSRP